MPDQRGGDAVDLSRAYKASSKMDNYAWSENLSHACRRTSYNPAVAFYSTVQFASWVLHNQHMLESLLMQ